MSLFLFCALVGALLVDRRLPSLGILLYSFLVGVLFLIFLRFSFPHLEGNPNWTIFAYFLCYSSLYLGLLSCSRLLRQPKKIWQLIVCLCCLVPGLILLFQIQQSLPQLFFFPAEWLPYFTAYFGLQVLWLLSTYFQVTWKKRSA